MNTISSLFQFIGNVIGANPNTLTSESKTLVGSINETRAMHADYITEKGKSGNWYYEKWNSGKVEMRGSFTTGTLSMTKSGDLYKKSNITITMPSGVLPAAPTFAEVTANYSDAVFVSAMCARTSATELTAQIWKATDSNMAVTLRVHVIYYPSEY